MRNLILTFLLGISLSFSAQISKKNFIILSNDERLNVAKDCLNKLINYHLNNDTSYCYDCFKQDLRPWSTFTSLYINAEKEFKYVKEIKSININRYNKVECTLTYFYVKNASKSIGGPKPMILSETYDCKIEFDFTEEGLSLLLGCY